MAKSRSEAASEMVAAEDKRLMDAKKSKKPRKRKKAK